MKKIISIVLCITVMLFICSCAQTSPQHGIQNVLTIGYPASSAFAEATTRILYYGGAVLRYYNKIEHDTGVFCFDPLCKHSGYQECIAYKFMEADGVVQPIEYCAFNNRFYALRGEKLCSFAFDGSDLKIDYSFGEMGDFDNMLYMSGGVVSLSISGKYVFLLAPNNESGRQGLMRYDVTSGKMEKLFFDEEKQIVSYLIHQDTIYIVLSGNQGAGFYRTDLNFENIHLISDTALLELNEGVFDGTAFYFYMDNSFVRFIPETDTFEKIIDLDTNDHSILAITDEYIYYTKREAVSIGFQVTEDWTEEVYNYRSKIYCLDKISGDITIALDDLTCETESLYFVGDIVLIQGAICTLSDTEAHKYSAMFTAKLDESGMMTELMLLEK